MSDGTDRAFGLDSIGVAEVIDAVTEILGYEIADIAGREGDATWPTVTLDPSIDAQWRDDLGRRAAEAASAVFWESDYSPGTPEGVLDMVRVQLVDEIATGTEDWRAETVDRLAEGLIERFPDLIGPESPYSEPRDLVAELEERLGLCVDTSAVDGIMERCEARTTLVIGTRADFDGDWCPSRRVLRSAAEWLDGPRESAWDPTTTDLAEDYSRCSAQWLCESQGTTLMEVVNGARGGFAESLRDAIVEDVGDSWGWPMIGVLTTMGLDDIARANTALGWRTPRGMEAPLSTVPTGRTPHGYPRQPNIVLTDPVNGSGQCVAIELDRPLDIALGNVCCAMRDGVGGKWGNWYTSQEIGDWLPSEFDRPLQKAAPADRAIGHQPVKEQKRGPRL